LFPTGRVGTNIQDRAIALHHLDCPWRPADIEQRDGRGLRQGNQNPEIRLFRYAVEGSFDSYSWQTVERKARFINQVMSGQLDQRQVDDIGDNALSYSEVKALASGDPLILDKARADADHARLNRLHRAWQRNQQTLRHTLAGTTDQADDYAQRAAAAADAIASRAETCGDAFHMTVDGHAASTRADAAQLIARWATTNQHAGAARPLPIGQLAGLDLVARVQYDPTNGQRILAIALRDVPDAPAELPLNAVTQDASPLIRQLEHRVRDLPALVQRLATRRQDALSEADAARHALTQPFKYAAELDQAAATRAEITEQIKARHEQAHDHDATPDAGEEAGHQRQALDAAPRRLASAAFPSPAPIPATPSASTHDMSRPPEGKHRPGGFPHHRDAHDETPTRGLPRRLTRLVAPAPHRTRSRRNAHRRRRRPDPLPAPRHARRTDDEDESARRERLATERNTAASVAFQTALDACRGLPARLVRIAEAAEAKAAALLDGQDAGLTAAPHHVSADWRPPPWSSAVTAHGYPSSPGSSWSEHSTNSPPHSTIRTPIFTPEPPHSSSLPKPPGKSQDSSRTTTNNAN
jgi:hypothetical protein